jgi:hypothetical protein
MGCKSTCVDNTPNNENTYHARFYFNPNAALPGNNNSVTLLQGLGAGGGGGTVLFQVQFQRTSAGQYQMRVTNGASTAAANITAWSNITNESHNVEVAFNRTATNPASRLQLFVDNISVGTLSYASQLTNNNNNQIQIVRLGAVTGNAATTVSNPVSGSIFLDGFVSTRTLPIGP